MTPRNKLGCVPNLLSAANIPKMTTPLFIGSATFNVAVSFNHRSYRFSEMLKMFRRAKFRGSKNSVKFLLTFYEKMSAASCLILCIVFCVGWSKGATVL